VKQSPQPASQHFHEPAQRLPSDPVSKLLDETDVYLK